MEIYFSKLLIRRSPPSPTRGVNKEHHPFGWCSLHFIRNSLQELKEGGFSLQSGRNYTIIDLNYMKHEWFTMDLQKLKTELSSIYKYRIELHAHTTPASACSEITPHELVEIYKSIGYSAVVVTNHFMYQHNGREKEEYINSFLEDFRQTEKYG